MVSISNASLLSISVTWTLVAELVDQPRRDLEASQAGPEDHDTRSRYLS
jgi:hypothetical protein